MFAHLQVILKSAHGVRGKTCDFVLSCKLCFTLSTKYLGGDNMKKALVLYSSLSGNTKEVADFLCSELHINDYDVHTHDMYYLNTQIIRSLFLYDIVLVGSYTWDYGETPDEVKDFIADFPHKPKNVAVFGSGDTQFGGGDVYCMAVRKLHKFFDSPYPPLMFEQSARGSQMTKVKKWIDDITVKNCGVKK